MTHKQEFIHFLKENNIYGKFFLKFKRRNTKATFNQFLSVTMHSDYFFDAFPWGYEEITLWQDISAKWIDKLNIPILFVQFLQQYNIEDEYLTIMQKNPYASKASIKFFIYNFRPSTYFKLFLWRNTKEGCDFWANIHRKWIDKLMTI